jgi:hypothetical protein
MKKFFGTILRVFVTIPALIGSLLPVFKACPPCPVCMPIYCGILSLIGLEIADYAAYLAPIMIGSMCLTLGSLFYQAQRYHKNYLSFLVTSSSCCAIIIAKFTFDFLPVVYLGMAGLITGIILNRRAMKGLKKGCCSK